MHNIASVKTEDLCSKIDLTGSKALLDIAGGPGTYAIAFAKANPHLRAVVFDLGRVIKLTRHPLRQHMWKTVLLHKRAIAWRIPLGRMSTMRFSFQTFSIFTILQTTP
jgi:hypothetical protein